MMNLKPTSRIRCGRMERDSLLPKNCNSLSPPLPARAVQPLRGDLLLVVRKGLLVLLLELPADAHVAQAFVAVRDQRGVVAYSIVEDMQVEMLRIGVVRDALKNFVRKAMWQ